MSSDEFALMQAIRANPADDTPRLVYADFLEELGDESNVARAEFIRVQCDLAALKSSDPRNDSLSERAANLLQDHREEWDNRLCGELREQFPSLSIGVGGQLQGWDYHRGMPSSVTARWEALIDQPRLFCYVGPIEHLSIFDGPETIEDDFETRDWNIRHLKVLTLQNDRAYQATTGGDNFLFFDELTSVPILDLPNWIHSIPNQHEIEQGILAGSFNPAVLIRPPNDPTMTIVVDPLNLWVLYRPWGYLWSESLGRGTRERNFNFMPTHARTERMLSARLRHLVHYYQLAGLPQSKRDAAPPYPLDERERPKRNIFTRAARWFRRGR